MSTYTIKKIPHKSAYGEEGVAYEVSRDEDGLTMGVFVWHSNALRWIEDRARKDKANAKAREKRQAMKARRPLSNLGG